MSPSVHMEVIGFQIYSVEGAEALVLLDIDATYTPQIAGLFVVLMDFVPMASNLQCWQRVVRVPVSHGTPDLPVPRDSNV